jgi:hypothetical protein
MATEPATEPSSVIGLGPFDAGGALAEVAFHPDGTLLGLRKDGVLVIWERSTGRRLDRCWVGCDHEAPCAAVGLRVQDGAVVVACQRAFRRLSWPDLVERVRFDVGSRTLARLFGVAGSRVAARSEGNELVLADLDTGKGHVRGCGPVPAVADEELRFCVIGDTDPILAAIDPDLQLTPRAILPWLPLALGADGPEIELCTRERTYAQARAC